ncbi:hypothetical protein P245_20890 [Comamonas thiooxydans]|uniref:Uncharacterized protein n=1 Tax=Comamonas thiooxydans TaxID=363952 RepID=A0A0E3B9R4_9BURK|nr:hypothetical protein [Comamonas thiooxydans]KGG86177.1 hypothetical protein P245_20890 [Comamonas thiooxydans]
MTPELKKSVVKPGMALEALRSHPALSNLNDRALQVARTCLVLAFEGLPLDKIPVADLALVHKQALAETSSEASFDVNAVYQRSGIQFINWNKRTGEWSPGIGSPPLASDGRKGGWIFFEVIAATPEQAKAMAQRYVSSKNATVNFEVVALFDEHALVNGEKVPY